jgi:CHASE3 domain sensor protein
MIKFNIKTKIILGFGTLFVLTGVIGITAIRQINSINKEVEDIYNHPFTVSNAVRDINISIYAANRSMKDVAMASDMKQFNLF